MRSDDQMARLTRRHTRARIHIESDTEFVENVILNRNEHEYPDPYLRNLNQPDVLFRYWKRIRTAVKNYTPSTENERDTIRVFVDREQERINTHIGALTIPAPEEYGIDADVVHAFRNVRLNIAGIGGRKIDWENLQTLYSASLDTLRYFSAYASVTNLCSDEQVNICNAFRYAKGDSTISLTNIVDIEDDPFAVPFDYTVDGEKISLFESDFVPEYISFEYDNLRDRIGGFIFGTALATISDMYLYNNNRIAHGMHRDGSIAYRRPFLIRERNIIYHEFFHAIQNILGVIDMNAEDSNVDLDGEYQSTEFDTLSNDSPLKGIQADMIVLWREFFNGEIDALCEYQTKNVHEFFAVAFEYYMEVPEKLKSEQPDVYELIDSVVSV